MKNREKAISLIEERLSQALGREVDLQGDFGVLTPAGQSIVDLLADKLALIEELEKTVAAHQFEQDGEGVFVPEFGTPDFYHYGVDGLVNKKLTDDEVQELITEAALAADELEEGGVLDVREGDTIVIAYREADQTRYIVARGYYESIVMDNGEAL